MPDHYTNKKFNETAFKNFNKKMVPLQLSQLPLFLEG